MSLPFIVECEYKIDGIKQMDVASEADWFLLRQSGSLVLHDVSMSVFSVNQYDKLTLKFKINGKYMTAEEIESDLKMLETFRDPLNVLRLKMKEQRLTQEDVAKKLGCSQANISMALNGYRMPSDAWIARLTRLLQEKP